MIECKHSWLCLEAGSKNTEVCSKNWQFPGGSWEDAINHSYALPLWGITCSTTPLLRFKSAKDCSGLDFQNIRHTLWFLWVSKMPKNGNEEWTSLSQRAEQKKFQTSRGGGSLYQHAHTCCTWKSLVRAIIMQLGFKKARFQIRIANFVSKNPKIIISTSHVQSDP